MPETKKDKRKEVLNIFLSEIFKNQILTTLDEDFKTNFPTLNEITEAQNSFLFKLWCKGVNAGLELNDAIAALLEIK